MAEEEKKIDVSPMRELLGRFELLEPLERICQENRVLLDWVLIGQRTKSVVRAREDCCAYLRTLEMSSTEIGKLLGMEHASVLAAIRRSKKKRPDGAPPAAGETPT